MSVLFAVLTVLTNVAYTVGFDVDRRQPAWVAYEIGTARLTSGDRPTCPFVADPRLPTSDVAADYVGSGYDRGHMAPAADMKWSPVAAVESFYFSNVCPQVPRFNRGRWREIETAVRRMAESGTVTVVTAPLYDGSTNVCGRLTVPTRFVKVAYGEAGFAFWVEENR